MPDHILGPLATLVGFLAFLLAGTLLDPKDNGLKRLIRWIKHRMWWAKLYLMWKLVYKPAAIRRLGGTFCTVWEHGTLCEGDKHSWLCPKRINWKAPLPQNDIVNSLDFAMKLHMKTVDPPPYYINPPKSV